MCWQPFLIHWPISVYIKNYVKKKKKKNSQNRKSVFSPNNFCVPRCYHIPPCVTLKVFPYFWFKWICKSLPKHEHTRTSIKQASFTSFNLHSRSTSPPPLYFPTVCKRGNPILLWDLTVEERCFSTTRLLNKSSQPLSSLLRRPLINLSALCRSFQRALGVKKKKKEAYRVKVCRLGEELWSWLWWDKGRGRPVFDVEGTLLIWRLSSSHTHTHTHKEGIGHTNPSIN